MKKFGLFLITLLLFSNLFGWGPLAHRIITEQAMQNLPEEMPVSEEWKDYIVQHCTDPDKRKDDTPGEEERHYIDIDFYEEFQRGRMIQDKTELIARYGEEKVIDMGLLPWTILETYENLKRAFQQNYQENILLYASDLAHYLADATQPQHLILNYNGKLTNQRGIHGRYETEMIARYEEEARAAMIYHPADSITVDLDLIFAYISNSNSLAPIIFDADLLAAEYDKDFGDEYYHIFWFRTKYITKLQFNAAARMLSSFIYTAWLETGKPEMRK